ncbi:12823_t:CDS:1, partial [Gigaspora rosea]
LWEKYLDDLIEDFIFEKDTKDLAIAKALVFIEKYLIQNRMAFSDFLELPSINYYLLEQD